MIDEYTKQSLLFDYYGGLLTKRQQELMNLYHEENLSLSEVAEELGISRQGVYDTVRNAEIALTGYEKKLKLVKLFEETEAAIKKIDSTIEELIIENTNNEQLKQKLSDIKNIIDNLNE